MGITHVHIAKTAGTFLRYYLRKALEPYKIGLDVCHTSWNNRGNKHDGFVFTFVRNPWEWHVSHYFHLCQSWQNPETEEFEKEFPTFNDFVLENERCNKKAFVRKYKSENFFFEELYNNVIKHELDFTGKVENIWEDINKLLLLNNVEIDIAPDAKKMYYDELKIKTGKGHKVGYTIHDPYLTYYTPETLDIVYEKNKNIIKNFGYEYECLKSV